MRRFIGMASLVLLVCSGLVGCKEQLVRETPATSCVSSGNLLQQVGFVAPDGERSRWTTSQHSSAPSFKANVEAGVLSISQEGDEPWFIFKQRLSDRSLAGKTLRFSAMTRGNIQTEPKIHGFEHVAGLYYRTRTLDRKQVNFSADKAPNTGDWDWQLVDVTFDVPMNVNWVEVGFVHKAGGVLQAKSPSLVVVDCD